VTVAAPRCCLWLRKSNQRRPLGRLLPHVGQIVEGDEATLMATIHAGWDVLAVDPPPARRVPVRRWFWLQHGTDQFHAPLRFALQRPNVTCLMASPWWARQIAQRRGTAVVTGLPHLDWVLDLAGPQRGFYSPGAPMAVYLPLPKQFGRRAQWHAAMKARRWARRRGWRLVVNLRPKDGHPFWLPWVADGVGVDGREQPPSILQVLRGASILLHHASTAVIEATAFGVQSIDFGAPVTYPLALPTEPADLTGQVGGSTERVLAAIV
jgi:hypothetical protein